ncbi:MAG TPA: dephospho-CoA kinase [Longimicrobiales bacterium]
MLRIGLTGNIASGKSAVANVWRRLGARIIDADVLARAAIAEGTPGHQRVIETFGTADRAKLRDVIFRDPVRRRQLEQIIHPEVARLRQEKEAELERGGVHVIVNDIPLLFEAGLQDQVDVIVLVDAPRDVRIQRIIDNREISRAEAERMVDAQMPSEDKRARADYVIDNSGTLEQLEQRAEATWQQLTTRASA